jgi:hypothetical protein
LIFFFSTPQSTRGRGHLGYIPVNMTKIRTREEEQNKEENTTLSIEELL